MNKSALWCSLLIFLILPSHLFAASVVDIYAERIDPNILTGKWEVTHWDPKLGVLQGTVQVSGVSELKLVLEGKNGPHTLTSTRSRFAWTGMIYRVEGNFPGDSSGEAVTTPKELPKDASEVLAPLDIKRLRISLGDGSAEIGVTPPSAVVAWNLRVTPKYDGTASVVWSKVMADGSVKQGGTQVWRSPQPQVEGIVVVYEQTGTIHGIVRSPYPFGNPKNPDGSTTRILLIYGKDMVQHYRGGGPRYTFDAMGEPIQYWLREESTNEKMDSFTKGQFEQGWAKVRAQGIDLSHYDAILVDASLKPGVIPGIKSMKVNGSQGNWHLQFGDGNAKITFVRDIFEDKFENTRKVLPMEHIYVQVETEVPLPIKEIGLHMGHNGKDYSLAGKEVTIATRIGGEKSCIYRTPPIALHNPDRDTLRPTPKPGELPWPVKIGDLLMAQLEEQGFLQTLSEGDSRAPGVSTAEVIGNPSQIGGLWKDGLDRTARCHNRPVDDWSKMSTKEAETIWNLIVLDLSVMEIKARFGDQAAMILLRDIFVEMMNKALSEYRQIRADETNVLKFRKIMVAQRDDDSNPFNRIKLKGPDGVSVDYSYTYHIDLLMKDYGFNKAQAERWAFEQTKVALDSLIKAIETAISRAKAAGDCNVEELIKITGFGFDAVVKELLPRLMRLEETTNPQRIFWVPDQVARGWVNGISTLAQAVKDQQAVSKIDNTFIALSLAAFAILPGAIPGPAALVALGLDAADVGFTLATDVPEYFAGQKELEFAKGASAVLGISRAEQAELEATPWYSTLISVLGSGFGASISSYDAVSSLSRLNQIRRGSHLTNKLKTEGIDTLTEAEKADFKEFICDAKFRQTKKGDHALNANQREALQLIDQIGKERQIAKAAPVKGPEEIRREMVHAPTRAEAPRAETGASAEELPIVRFDEPSPPTRPSGDDTPKLRLGEDTVKTTHGADSSSVQPPRTDDGLPKTRQPEGTAGTPRSPPSTTRPPEPKPEGDKVISGEPTKQPRPTSEKSEKIPETVRKDPVQPVKPSSESPALKTADARRTPRPGEEPAQPRAPPEEVTKTEKRLPVLSRQEAKKASNLVEDHAEGFSQVAKARNEIIMTRPVNPDGTSCIAENAATKNMHIKGKSSNWGPQKGYIPVKQKYSKLGKIEDKSDRLSEILKYDTEVKECLKNKYAIKKPLKKDGKTVTVARDKITGEERLVLSDDQGRFFDHETGKRLSPEQFEGRGEPLEVLADPKSGKYLTADYDLLAIASKKPPGKMLNHTDMGSITADQMETVRDLNKAVKEKGYKGGNVVHHGPENQFPKTEGPDYPITAFQPDGKIIHIPEGPPGDPDRYLKDYFHQCKKQGYYVEPHEKWGWGKYDSHTGWK